MSTPKTPRTDARLFSEWFRNQPIVAADFARQLETELADMTALAKRLAGALHASHPVSVAWSAQYGYTHNKGNVHETHQLIIDKINAALTLAREKGVL